MDKLVSLEDNHETPEINITPLIDVVFVVLISFILIAPLVKMEEIDLAAASPKEASLIQSSPFQIVVKEDNSIWINNNKVTINQLERFLTQQNNKKSLQLLYDQKATFGTYKKIKNLAEEIGFDQMQLIVKDK